VQHHSQDAKILRDRVDRDHVDGDHFNAQSQLGSGILTCDQGHRLLDSWGQTRTDASVGKLFLLDFLLSVALLSPGGIVLTFFWLALDPFAKTAIAIADVLLVLAIGAVPLAKAARWRSVGRPASQVAPSRRAAGYGMITGVFVFLSGLSEDLVGRGAHHIRLSFRPRLQFDAAP
jgi:hypothetical protein